MGHMTLLAAMGRADGPLEKGHDRLDENQDGPARFRRAKLKATATPYCGDRERRPIAPQRTGSVQ